MHFQLSGRIILFSKSLNLFLHKIKVYKTKLGQPVLIFKMFSSYYILTYTSALKVPQILVALDKCLLNGQMAIDIEQHQKGHHFVFLHFVLKKEMPLICLENFQTIHKFLQ